MALVKLETGGLVCPFPLIDAKKKMAELAVGDELLIAFDCTQATESIPNWAADNGSKTLSLLSESRKFKDQLL